jgi:hypothetical protein
MATRQVEELHGDELAEDLLVWQRLQSAAIGEDELLESGERSEPERQYLQPQATCQAKSLKATERLKIDLFDFG